MFWIAKTGQEPGFSLFLFLVDGVGASDRIVFLELEFLVRELLLILSGVVDMALTDALFIAYRNQSYEFVL